ncbi:hypothetical protein BJ742DRAFT_736907 [Cladochytrium replicatum]|nr:hypothetical protein BJ742DRAFT_736907 [Cladochytrium replicatum]
MQIISETAGISKLIHQYAYGHDTPRDFKYYCRPNRSEVLQWNWYPSSCELFPFYPLEMQARILTKRKILFIGDSLLEELSYSMSVLSGVPLNWTRSCTLVDYHTTKPMPPDHYRFCQCRHNGTNCELAPKTAPSGLVCPEGQVAQHRESRNYEWTSMIKDYNTLVISVGHHWRKEDPQFERYPEMVENVLTYLSKNFGGLIIYMMAPMGHLGCSNYRKPITRDQLATFKRPNEKYMWLEAVYAQEHWLSISRNIPTLKDRFYILNTTMLMYRPDGHIEGFKNDCLHWCLPGPLDTIAHLLFNLLMQLQIGY